MDNLTKALKESHALFPQLRHGQLLLNAIPEDLDLFYVTDDELAEYLEVYNKSFKLEGGEIKHKTKRNRKFKFGSLWYSKYSEKELKRRIK